MKKYEIKEFLDEKTAFYLRPDFINNDPISIPHQFNKKEDIEISAFLSATIAWGRRSMIIKNANRMMEIMDNTPYEFIINANLVKIHFLAYEFNAFEPFMKAAKIKNVNNVENHLLKRDICRNTYTQFM